MAKESGFDLQGQLSHSVFCSTLDDAAPASYLQKEKDVEVPYSPPDLVYRQHVLDDFPDGGLRAWLVVLGGSSAALSTFGFVISFGVFQDYYQNVLLKGTSPSKIAWIGSTQYALAFLPALISGRLFDIGHFRVPLFAASINIILCTLLIAECHDYWHFLLCQGFGVGVSCGLIFVPVISIIAHWFKRRRSTAIGLVTFSSSIGGAVFPAVFHNLNAKLGFKWSMRIIAFMLMFTLGITNLTLRRRLPPVNASGGLFNPKQFKSAAYSVYVASSFVASLGLFTVLTFIDTSAPSQGVPDNLSTYLVSIANAGSAIGRIIGGTLADRVGAINTMAPSILFTSILTFLWPHLRGTGAFVPLALFYGASSGIFSGLAPVPMAAFGDNTDVGRRTGMYFTILSLGVLAGPPISGAIYRSSGGYAVVGIYAGSMVMVGVVLLALSRYFVLRGWKGKV